VLNLAERSACAPRGQYCCDVKFRITRHSGHLAPPDAMELLLRRLGARRDEVSFAMVGTEIRATTDEAEGDAQSRDARVQASRQAVFDLIDETCRDAPELESGWFAVSHLA
jgi:hypothetical protein